MRLRYVAAAFVLLGMILTIEYDIARRTQEVVLTEQTKKVRQPQEVTVSAEAAKKTPPSLKNFEARFINETEKIAQLQADPTEVEKKLEAFALSMTSQDVADLSKIAQNTSRSGDERVMAVELLSRKKTPEALQALTDFVKNHEATTQKNWSRSKEFESVIRAQAVEGIAAYPQKESALTSLNGLAQKVDESFLLDRILRSSENVKGSAAAIDQQDDAALKKLIE